MTTSRRYNPPHNTPQSADAILINDHDHTLTWVEPRSGAAGVHIGQGGNRLFLSPAECARLIDAMTTELDGQPNRTAYTTTTPAKAMARMAEPSEPQRGQGKLQRYPATKR
jgi:hypothetical protein